MEYTDVILRLLREALERYRLQNRANGRERSWKQVAFDIFEPPLTLSDQEVDALLKPEAESLRRFTAGKQTPTPERLDRLREFLIDEECLAESDLATGDATAADVRALYKFFDFRPGGIFPFPRALIAASAAPHDRTELRILRTWQEGEGLRVSEAIYWVSSPPRLNDMQNLESYLEKNNTGKFVREGWLVETPARQLLFFFKDPLRRSTTYSTVVYDGRDLESDFPRGTMWVLDHLDFSNPDGYQEHFPSEDLKGANLTTMAVHRWTAAQLRRYGMTLTWES